MVSCFVQRIWRKNQLPAKASSFVLWDMGHELWELKEGLVRHFRVVEREFMNSEQVREVLELLPETPIPLEALGCHVVGSEWEVQEEVMQKTSKRGPRETQQPRQQAQQPRQQQAQQPRQQQAQQPRQAQQLRQASSTTSKQPSKQGSKQPRPVQSSPPLKEECQSPLPSLPQTPLPSEVHPPLPEPPKQPSEELLAKQSLQDSYSLPMELWWSLSQWIPPSALYQPSLHALANAELSDKQAPTSQAPRFLGQNSRPSQARRPYSRQDQQSKPSLPKTTLPSPQILVS